MEETLFFNANFVQKCVIYEKVDCFLQTGKLTSISDLGLSLQNPNSIVMLQDFLVK